MRKPYILVSGITKKSLQLREGVNIYIIVPVYYISVNALRIHGIKMNRKYVSG